jgi:glycosyltransferase involved in cell wall biosynthesis
MLKVNYTCAKYQSLARTAADYSSIIGERYQLTERTDADVIILHCLPYQIAGFVRHFPELTRKHLIGYCVWETDKLPELFKASIPHLEEIWTCSEYCREVFARYHPKVFRIPHIIERDITYSQRDRGVVKLVLGYEEGACYFLSMGSWADPRKNLEALARAFARVSGRMPDARLILKVAPGERPPDLDPHIICTDSYFSETQLNALYDLSFACISPHHSEGWGLTLSDAMLFGKPVAAVGYSGNLEFMTADNSVFLDYEETHVQPKDLSPLFSPEMKWAYPNEESMGEKMLWLYEHRGSAELEELVTRARASVARFSRQAIAPLVWERLAALEQSAAPMENGGVESL